VTGESVEIIGVVVTGSGGQDFQVTQGALAAFLAA
jgi:hypothetical protein